MTVEAQRPSSVQLPRAGCACLLPHSRRLAHLELVEHALAHLHVVLRLGHAREELLRLEGARLRSRHRCAGRARGRSLAAAGQRSRDCVAEHGARHRAGHRGAEGAHHRGTLRLTHHRWRRGRREGARRRWSGCAHARDRSASDDRQECRRERRLERRQVRRQERWHFSAINTHQDVPAEEPGCYPCWSDRNP